MAKHNQRFLWVYRENGVDYEDITDYVSGTWSSNLGDVSGVGEQGSDGVAGTAQFRVVNTDSVNFNPTIFNGVYTYTRETIVGNGIDTVFNLSNGHVLPGTVTIFSTVGDFVTTFDTDNNFSANTCQITASKPLPSGNTVIQYKYFNKSAQNSINWFSASQDSLLQSNRYVRMINRNGDLVVARQTINGDGGDTYPLTAIADGSRIATSIAIISSSDWDNVYTSDIKIFESGGNWFFKFGDNTGVGASISIGETVTVQFSYNNGTDRTVFYGLLGDKIIYDPFGVTCHCRDETKILQSVPVVFDDDGELPSKWTREKIRKYESAEKLLGEGLSCTAANPTTVSGNFKAPGFNLISGFEIDKRTVVAVYSGTAYQGYVKSYPKYDQFKLDQTVPSNTGLTTVYYMPPFATLKFSSDGATKSTLTLSDSTISKSKVDLKALGLSFGNKIGVYYNNNLYYYTVDGTATYNINGDYTLEIIVDGLVPANTNLTTIYTERIEFLSSDGATQSIVTGKANQMYEGQPVFLKVNGVEYEGDIESFVSSTSITVSLGSTPPVSSAVNLYEKNSKGMAGWLLKKDVTVNGSTVTVSDANLTIGNDNLNIGDYILIGDNIQLSYKISNITYSSPNTTITLSQSTGLSSETRDLYNSFPYGIPVDLLLENTFKDFLGSDYFPVRNTQFPEVIATTTVNSDGADQSTITGSGFITTMQMEEGNWCDIAGKKYVITTLTDTSFVVESRGEGTKIVGTGLTLTFYPGNLNVNYPEINVNWWEYKNLKTFANSIVSQNGQYEGFRYKDETDLFLYTILRINRDNTTEERTLSFENDFNKKELSYTDNNYRDGVIVYFKDTSNTKRRVIYGEKELNNTGDTGLNELTQPMIMTENLTSGILTVEEATRLAEDIYKDVQSGVLQQSRLEMPFDQEAELFELIKYEYPWIFNSDQKFATDSIQHDWINQTTSKSVSNRRKGGVSRWRKNEVQPGRFRPTTADHLTSVNKISAPRNLKLKGGNINVENLGQIVGITASFEWVRPNGFLPTNYQLEIKKQADSWDSADVIKKKTAETLLKVEVEDRTIYDVRVASINKNGKVGNYSSVISLDTGQVSSESKVLHIRTQDQLNDWLSSTTVSFANYTDVMIYKKTTPYNITITTTPFTFTGEEVRIYSVGAEIIFTNNGNSIEGFIFNANRVTFKDFNIKLVTSTTTSTIFNFININETSTEEGICDITNNYVEKTGGTQGAAFIRGLSTFDNTTVNIIKNKVRNFSLFFNLFYDFRNSNARGYVYQNEYYADTRFVGGVSGHFFEDVIGMYNIEVVDNKIVNGRIVIDDMVDSTIKGNTFIITADWNAARRDFINISDTNITKKTGNRIEGNFLKTQVTSASTYDFIKVNTTSMQQSTIVSNVAQGGTSGWLNSFINITGGTGLQIANNTKN